jgi:hypothetical protein
MRQKFTHIVHSLGTSNKRLKEKNGRRKEELKYWKNRSRDLEESRDKWKDRTKQCEKELEVKRGDNDLKDYKKDPEAHFFDILE